MTKCKQFISALAIEHLDEQVEALKKLAKEWGVEMEMNLDYIPMYEEQVFYLAHWIARHLHSTAAPPTHPSPSPLGVLLIDKLANLIYT